MAVAWEPLALPGLISGILSFALAVTVYWARPRRLQNRVLAVFLVCTGATWFFLRGIVPLLTDPEVAYGARVTGTASHWAAHGMHLILLSTLDTPLVRPLRGRGPRLLVATAAVALAVSVVLWPDWWIGPMVPANYVGTWRGSSGFGQYAFAPVFAALWTFGVVAAVSMYRRSSALPDRRQARAYMRAFVGHDGLLAPLSLIPTSLWGNAGEFVGFAFPLANIWLVVWLSYGILRTQLFGVELRIKWTLRQSTVAAAFVGVFFIVSEGAALLFSAQIGPWLGILAAGALVFALAPLQNLARRVADKAMPGVQDTQEYRLVRKREVYRAAVESALQDGRITEKERDILATLAEQLGLRPTEARGIEREGTGIGRS